MRAGIQGNSTTQPVFQNHSKPAEKNVKNNNSLDNPKVQKSKESLTVPCRKGC